MHSCAYFCAPLLQKIVRTRQLDERCGFASVKRVNMDGSSNPPIMMRPTRPELVGSVKQIWVLESSCALSQRVYGTGNPQLLLHTGAPFIEGIAGSHERCHSAVHLCGQVTQFCDVTAPAGTRTIGIVFHPAALRAFVNVPAVLVADGRVAPADLGPCMQNMVSLPLAERPIHECLPLIEDSLVRGMRGDAQVPLARRVVDLILQSHSVAAVLREVSWSERKLQRFFSDYIGLSPREFLSVARLQTALKLMRTQSAARAAMCAGYFDQPHFIKSCKSRTGYTPSEYAQACWATAPAEHHANQP